MAVAEDTQLPNDSTESVALSLLQLSAERAKGSFFHGDSAGVGDPLQFTTEDTGYWVWGTYHRTGSEFVRQLCKKLNYHSRPKFRFFGSEKDFDFHPWRNWYYQPNMEVLHSLPDYRFVHTIRDPADLIVSAYQFHLMGIDEFLQKPMIDRWGKEFYGYLPELKRSEYTLRHNVPKEHQPLLQRLFQAVDDGKSLPEFYKSESQVDGVVAEAYRSWWQIDMMQDNYNATRSDSKALQVRMDDMKERFEEKVGCIFDFLNEAHPFEIPWAMEKVDQMDFQKHGAKALPEHDTRLVTCADNTEVLKMVVWETVPYISDAVEELSKEAIRQC